MANDLELQIECCLFSASLFKSILAGTISNSKYDIDYATDNINNYNADYLLPSYFLNSDSFRFNIRYVISSLNFICLELIKSGHYLNALPSLTLYEYFSRKVARDLTHTVFSRLIKIEALIKLNMFSEAIILLNRLNNGDQFPHSIDDSYRKYNEEKIKYFEFVWDSSKPIYDLKNLRVLKLNL